MKLWLAVVLILALVLIIVPAVAAQKNAVTAIVPKYDPAAEATYSGTVTEVRDRQCPMSGGMGAHAILKLSDGTSIEVHMASSAFVKAYDLTLKPGDKVEVKGMKVRFEGVDTIFAREVKRGNDIFEFRDKQGKPVW